MAHRNGQLIHRLDNHFLRNDTIRCGTEKRQMEADLGTDAEWPSDSRATRWDSNQIYSTICDMRSIHETSRCSPKATRGRPASRHQSARYKRRAYEDCVCMCGISTLEAMTGTQKKKLEVHAPS